MKNIALILQNRPNTKLHIENHSDPADGNISICLQLRDSRTEQLLVGILDWRYDLQETINELDERCTELGKRWKKPYINIGVR